jgi:hypothetical protein
MSQSRTRHKKESLSLTLPPPRNPLALAARQRNAGSHRKSGSAKRQQLQREVRKMLTEK